MPKCEFEKKFNTLIDDFNLISGRAITAFVRSQEKEAAQAKKEEEELKEKEQEEAAEKGEKVGSTGSAGAGAKAPEVIDPDEIFSSALDRALLRTRNECEKVDSVYESLEEERAELSKKHAEASKKLANAQNPAAAAAAAKAAPDAEKEAAQILAPFTKASENLEKALEAFTLKVRAELVGRKDLGDKFSRAANELFLGLKKFDDEVNKFVSTELKKTPREEKKLEVMPSKFLADYQAIMKKQRPAKVDPGLGKLMKDAEERLKKVDTNGAFNRVTALCDGAQTALVDIYKELDKKEAKLIKELKDLAKEVENYDNHMFLLSRM